MFYGGSHLSVATGPMMLWDGPLNSNGIVEHATNVGALLQLVYHPLAGDRQPLAGNQFVAHSYLLWQLTRYEFCGCLDALSIAS